MLFRSKPKDMPSNYPSVVERDLSSVSFELKFKVEKEKEEAVENLAEQAAQGDTTPQEL